MQSKVQSKFWNDFQQQMSLWTKQVSKGTQLLQIFSDAIQLSRDSMAVASVKLENTYQDLMEVGEELESINEKMEEIWSECQQELRKIPSEKLTSNEKFISNGEKVDDAFHHYKKEYATKKKILDSLTFSVASDVVQVYSIVWSVEPYLELSTKE